jgi:hypothetical protein
VNAYFPHKQTQELHIPLTGCWQALPYSCSSQGVGLVFRAQA